MSSTLEPNLFSILFSFLGLEIESNTEAVLAILCFVVTIAWLIRFFWNRKLRNYGLPRPHSLSYRIFYGVGLYWLVSITLFLVYTSVYIPAVVNNDKIVQQIKFGDYVLVNRFIYQYRIPLTNKFIKRKEPQRGDLILYRDGRIGQKRVSRIIALPGDIVEINLRKKLFRINEKDQFFHFQIDDQLKTKTTIKLIVPTKVYLIRSDIINQKNIHRTKYVKARHIIGKLEYQILNAAYSFERSGPIPEMKK